MSETGRSGFKCRGNGEKGNEAGGVDPHLLKVFIGTVNRSATEKEKKGIWWYRLMNEKNEKRRLTLANAWNCGSVFVRRLVMYNSI